MRLARFLPFLALLLASGCQGVPVEPVNPPTPPGPVVPVDPPVPVVIPPSRVGTGEDAAQVAVGMSATNLFAVMKVVPIYDTEQDDGTRLVEYAIVDVDGKAKSLVVHLSKGVVIGRVRVPRATPK